MSKIVDLIRRKRDGDRWTEAEVNRLIGAVTTGEMEQCQLGSMLMAVFQRGMTSVETLALTRAMMASGKSFSWPDEWKGSLVDKHSTGGVGDKVSLILTPALAACGLRVPMISGRGLGFSGGTLDKMESIPGFQVSCDMKRVIECLTKAGCCIAGQTDDIVPADRVMYACRGITATVECVPLIVGSIIAKKAVENISALVLDIKVGRAAFMTDVEQANRLAEGLVTTSNQLGIKTVALLTTMDWPVGRYIGNALEVAEAVYGLQGKLDDDLKELVLISGAHLLLMTGLVSNLNQGAELMWSKIKDGSALLAFRDLILSQGVSEDDAARLCEPEADVWSVLPAAKHQTEVCHHGDDGYIHDVDARILAEVCMDLGTGRLNQQDSISYSAGLRLVHQVGSFLNQGDPWIIVHHDQPLPEAIFAKLLTALTVDNQAVPPEKLTRVLSTVQSSPYINPLIREAA